MEYESCLPVEQRQMPVETVIMSLIKLSHIHSRELSTRRLALKKRTTNPLPAICRYRSLPWSRSQ
jgi:hypothetical protein